jgi:hypothetical protein
MVDYILPSKVAIIQQEVFVGVMKALNENHHSNNGVKLATKHALLTAAISAHSESSIIDVAGTFCIHHRNILVVFSWWKLIDDNGIALWSLSIRKKKDLWSA